MANITFGKLKKKVGERKRRQTKVPRISSLLRWYPTCSCFIWWYCSCASAQCVLVLLVIKNSLLATFKKIENDFILIWVDRPVVAGHVSILIVFCSLLFFIFSFIITHSSSLSWVFVSFACLGVDRCLIFHRSLARHLRLWLAMIISGWAILNHFLYFIHFSVQFFQCEWVFFAVWFGGSSAFSYCLSILFIWDVFLSSSLFPPFLPYFLPSFLTSLLHSLSSDFYWNSCFLLLHSLLHCFSSTFHILQKHGWQAKKWNSTRILINQTFYSISFCFWYFI